MKIMSASEIAEHSNTCETTPRHHWLSQVIQLADVSWDDMITYCTLERLSRWGSAGEPVWMAADSLRKLVHDGKREERANRELSFMRKALRAGKGSDV